MADVVLAAQERLLTIRELAKTLGISPRQCWKLLASGRLVKPVRLGRSVRWRWSDVSEFIARGCVVSESGAGR